jgi:hypothetical protein
MLTLILFAIYPRVVQQDYMVILFLVFLRECHTDCCISWDHLYSHQQWLSSPFHHIFFNICCGCFLDDSHFDWKEMVSQYSFDLHLSDDKDMEHFYMYLFTFYTFSFEKYPFSSFAHLDYSLLKCLVYTHYTYTYYIHIHIYIHTIF